MFLHCVLSSKVEKFADSDFLLAAEPKDALLYLKHDVFCQTRGNMCAEGVTHIYQRRPVHSNVRLYFCISVVDSEHWVPAKNETYVKRALVEICGHLGSGEQQNNKH